jgi:hypothetical protein
LVKRQVLPSKAMSVQEFRKKLAASTDVSSGFDELEKLVAMEESAMEEEKSTRPPPAFADTPAVVHESLPSVILPTEEVVLAVPAVSPSSTTSSGETMDVVETSPPAPKVPRPTLPRPYKFADPRPYDTFAVHKMMQPSIRRVLRLGFMGVPGESSYGPCIFYYHPQLKLYLVRGFDHAWPAGIPRRKPYVTQSATKSLMNDTVIAALGGASKRARPAPTLNKTSLDVLWLLWRENSDDTVEVDGYTTMRDSDLFTVKYGGCFVQHGLFWAARVPSNGRCTLANCTCDVSVSCCPWLKDHDRALTGSIAKSRATNPVDTIDLS